MIDYNIIIYDLILSKHTYELRFASLTDIKHEKKVTDGNDQ